MYELWIRFGFFMLGLYVASFFWIIKRDRTIEELTKELKGVSKLKPRLVNKTIKK